MEKYQSWLNNVSLEDKEILKSMSDEDIKKCFSSELSFGTAGLRATMGLGTNKLNIYTIKHTSQCVANYLNKNYKNPTLAIGYDSRIGSREFAIASATVFAANGVKTYIYETLMPTPALSFAVRYLKTSGGIIITASHNPKEYNGYKVYDNVGCQLGVEPADLIAQDIASSDTFDVKEIAFEDGLKNGSIEWIKPEVKEAFISSDLNQSVLPNQNRIIKIAYTAFNGAGATCVPEALTRDGFKLDLVKEQMNPDGNFPTCPQPNPENHDTLMFPINNYLLKNNNDVLLATDPDSDRVGVVVNQGGKPVFLNGDAIGVLLFNFLLENNKLNSNSVLVKTIVSTDLVKLIANKNNVQVKEVLTGFKFIGEQIATLESQGRMNDFALGFEESCGYLTNTNIRDKDAINACILIAEMADSYLKQGLTLADKYNKILEIYGDFVSVTLNYATPDTSVIPGLMKKFKETYFNIFEGIIAIEDYDLRVRVEGDKVIPLDLPKANVFKVFLKNNETVTLRPSGTEPKVKAYVFANGQSRLNEIKSKIDEFMKF